MWIPQIGMPRAWIILLKQMKQYLSFICTVSKGHAKLVKSVLKCAKLQRVAIIDLFLIRTDTNPDNQYYKIASLRARRVSSRDAIFALARVP